MSVISNFSDVISKWDTAAAFARDIGIKPKHAQTMRERGYIPPAYWPEIVKAAQKRGHEQITYDLLARVAAKVSRERAES